MDLRRRIELILAHNNLTQRELARRAGLANEGNLSVLLHRLKVNPRARAETDTLERLARAGGVSLEWLATGEGAGIEPDSTESPLEQALALAFDGQRHSLRDVDSVRHALRASVQWQDENADLTEAARAWLDAAAWLRRDGKPVTVESLLTRLALGRKPTPSEITAYQQRIAALREEVASQLEDSGLAPGHASDLGKRIAEKFRRLSTRGGE